MKFHYQSKLRTHCVSLCLGLQSSELGELGLCQTSQLQQAGRLAQSGQCPSPAGTWTKEESRCLAWAGCGGLTHSHPHLLSPWALFRSLSSPDGKAMSDKMGRAVLVYQGHASAVKGLSLATL